MRTSKAIALILVLLMSFTIVGCGGGDASTGAGGEQEKTVTLHIGATSTPEHSFYRAADAFMQEVEEKSGGTLKISRDFGGVHGGERQMVESCMRGELDMVFTSDVGLAAVIPSTGFTQLPYLFTGYEDIDNRYFNGWMGEKIAADCLEKGIRVLSFAENDYRSLTNSKQSIKSGADLQGLKVRVPEVPMYLSFFKELGTLPTPMSVTELPTALQQKTIDGQDNGAILTYSYGYSQFQDYVTKLNHIYSGAEIIISEKVWNTLSDEHKAILEEATKKYGANQIKMNRQDVEEFYGKMEQEGVEVIDPTPELIEYATAAAMKVWDAPEQAKAYGQDVIDRIKAEANI